MTGMASEDPIYDVAEMFEFKTDTLWSLFDLQPFPQCLSLVSSGRKTVVPKRPFYAR